MPLPFALRSIVVPLLLPIPLRIASGPNEGRRWSLASGRYRKGTIEADRMEVVRALVKAGDAFWDVGAHHGYVTLLASRCVGAAGIVYAFEPSPYNLAYLRKHVAWNRSGNVSIVPIALSDHEGMVGFSESGSSPTFHVGTGPREVEVASLPALLHRGFRPPDVLKLDVEGSEGAIIAASVHRLPADCRVLVSIHSQSNYEAVTSALRGAGFTVIESPLVARLRDTEPDEWSDDPDVLAIGPECQDVAKAIRLFGQGRRIAGE